MNTRTEAAEKAWKTRRNNEAWMQARGAERESKKAFERYCHDRKWRVAFIAGPTHAPRTGIVDAVAFRIDHTNPDQLEIFLVQLKGGHSGLSAEEIARLKSAAKKAEASRCGVRR